MIDRDEAIGLMVVGGIGIAAGFLFKKFYAATGLYGIGGLGRPIKTWQGRAIFFSIGGFMFLAGLHYFILSLL